MSLNYIKSNYIQMSAKDFWTPEQNDRKSI